MSDFGPLHRRLRRAIDLSSLLVLGALAPACASTQDQDAPGKSEVAKADETKTEPDAAEPDAAKPVATKPEPEPTKSDPTITITKPPPQTDPRPMIPEPMPNMHIPSCPTIEWCSTGSIADAMRPAAIDVPPADVEGCPGAIQRSPELPRKLFKGHEPPPGGTSDWAAINTEATKAKRAAGDADTCCYDWTIPCPGGRPLLVDGRPWLASLQAGRSWSARLPEPSSVPALPEHLRERIADAWLRDALTEHASIASFARARAELEAIDAPAELLRACERAAEDEVEHARLCFALAERWSGRALEPTALPLVAPRGGGAIAVALDTFVEGCVGETIAAACARRAAASATDPVVRAVLERIADDETEHAALAWRTIAWLTRREGPRVLAAILELAEELRPQPTAPHAEEPDAALLLAHGRLDARTLARTRALAWRELVDPLLAELGAGGPHARGRVDERCLA